MKPVNIDQISDEVITIKWDDNHESLYFAQHLREFCPCASCERRDGDNNKTVYKMLKLHKKSIKILSWSKYGNYAINFHFSDGHKTGIYTYEKLRELCQCDECEKNRTIRIEGPLKLG